jgi:putative transposase
MNIETPNDEDYDHLDHVVCRCLYHVIFCPKYRRKVLIDGVDVRLKELILQKQQELRFKVIEVEVMSDHVHLLLRVNPKIGVYRTISLLKGFTSHALREEFSWLKQRLPTLWTRSKFIATVGSVSLEVVKRYVEDQKKV